MDIQLVENMRKYQSTEEKPKPNKRYRFKISNMTDAKEITCTNLLDQVQRDLQHHSESGDHWQTIIANTSYVYSAFTDPRIDNNLVIRMMGIALKTFRDPLYCQLWPKESKDAYVVRAEMELIVDEHWPKYYS